MSAYRQSRHHLILGGSEGIGFAYARVMAIRGDILTVVARRSEVLEAAQKSLIQAGARTCHVISGDLLDADFRVALKRRSDPYDAILVSGPSPAPGGIELLTTPDWEDRALHACRAALIYPLDILAWAEQGGIKQGGDLILVASAATQRPEPHPHFLLSQLFRQSLESLVSQTTTQRFRVHCWRPSVVLTPLAERYYREAVYEHPKPEIPPLQEWLVARFPHALIETADQFVRRMLHNASRGRHFTAE